MNKKKIKNNNVALKPRTKNGVARTVTKHSVINRIDLKKFQSVRVDWLSK